MQGAMRVMVRVPNWVGDAVMAVPALRELRRIFGDARITLVARPWVAGLFDGEGLADELIAIEASRGALESAKRFAELTLRFRRDRFDFAVLLQNAFGAALAARAGGVRKIAGYPTDSRRLLLHFSIPVPSDHKTAHQVTYYLNIASSIERELAGESQIDLERPLPPKLNVGLEAKERALTLIGEFAGAPLSPTSRILAINPGATNSRAKQWIAERYANVADTLAREDGFQTIIVGAAGDIEAANKTVQHMASPAIALAGKTTIAQLKAVLACASLLISNDTGAAHVSAALGVPTVVVFGPTEHFSTRPLSDVVTVVRHDVECSPCMLRDCPIDHRCMTRVEVNDVYQASRRLLAATVGLRAEGPALSPRL